MRHCPWCEEYIKSYLHDDGILTKDELEEDRKRIENGFWASISQVNDEQYLMNKALGLEDALKRRMPVQIDVKSGETYFGRFWCYELAEKRDEITGEDLEHMWFLSGGCSMSWMTPICCEQGNVSDNAERLRWEVENF